MKRLSKPDYETSLMVKEVSAPSTPSAGYIEVYAKVDGKLYIKDPAGVETDLTATGGSAAATDYTTSFMAMGA